MRERRWFAAFDSVISPAPRNGVPLMPRIARVPAGSVGLPPAIATAPRRDPC